MGQYGGIIGGVVGAVVGFFAGGNVYAGWMIGSAIGGAYSASQQVIPGPKIGDVSRQTAQEGGPRPIVYARSQPIAGNIICDGGPRIVKRKESQGKGGPKVETESAYRTYAVGVCEGPITEFLQVWKNNQLVYDIEDASMFAENAEFLRYARFYYGDYEQMPSPDLEAVKGAGNVPAHRGTAYMVLKDEDVTDQRGMWSQWVFRVFRGEKINQGIWWATAFPEASASSRLVSKAGSDLVFSSIESRPSPGVALLDSPRAGDQIIRTNTGSVIVFGNSRFVEVYEDTNQPPSIVQISTQTGSTLHKIVICGDYLVARMTHEKNFYLSQDGGYTWVPSSAPDGLYVGDINMIPSGRFVMFAHDGPLQQFYYSNLGEPSGWTSTGSTSFPNTGDQTNIFVARNRVFCVGTLGRVFLSNNGLVWSETGAGVVSPAAFEFGNSNGNVAFVFGQQSGSVSYTLDGGLSFINPNTSVWPGENIFRNITYGEGKWVLSTGSRSNFASIFAYESDLNTWFPVDGLDELLVSDRGWTISYLNGSSDYKDSTYSLKGIIDDISDRCDNLSHVNASLLSGRECRGFTITNAYPASGALSELSKVFFFDPSNYDGRINFIPRGSDFKKIIVEDQMLDDGNEFRYEVRKGDTLAVPRVLHLNYFDVAGGLNTDKQISEKPFGSRSVGEQSLQTVVVLSADEAATVVAVNHGAMSEAIKGELEFSLGDNYISLAESDPVIVQADGKSMRCVVSKVEIDDGQQTYRLYRDRQSLYSLKVQGIPAAPVPRPPSSIAGPTAIEVLDIPILRDADDRLGFYIAISGTTPAWQGAFVELSLDGGENYDEGQRVTATTQIGYTQSVMGDHPQAYPDSISKFMVRMSTPDSLLTGTTLAGMMNRRNIALIGDEIINFASADEVTPNVWELSYFLRGRKGTATAEHAEGSRFVMLDGAIFVPSDLALLNRTLTFRATTFGRPLDEATVTTMVFTGQSQRERRPAYLSAYRSGSTIIANWQGVGRLGGGVNVAMGAYFAAYRVSATDGVTTSTQDVSTMTASIDTSIFTGPVTVSVSQVNSLTGAGQSIEVVVQ